ncbi:hypothetical protein Tco_0709875 [Tanacetum coccineum]
MSDSEHLQLLVHHQYPRTIQTLVHQEFDGPPIMPEDPYAYIMAAYGVPPSPDYIPGPEVPPSPDYTILAQRTTITTTYRPGGA